MAAAHQTPPSLSSPGAHISLPNLFSRRLLPGMDEYRFLQPVASPRSWVQISGWIAKSTPKSVGRCWHENCPAGGSTDMSMFFAVFALLAAQRDINIEAIVHLLTGTITPPGPIPGHPGEPSPRGPAPDPILCTEHPCGCHWRTRHGHSPARTQYGQHPGARSLHDCRGPKLARQRARV